MIFSVEITGISYSPSACEKAETLINQITWRQEGMLAIVPAQKQDACDSGRVSIEERIGKY